ncbi:MAG: hypoxanthine phosphoribosyltransferase [Phycisphaerales bacterium]|nr:hypoxanthine phosphoribosyltransferase [Phycisphaerales bacterium]
MATKEPPLFRDIDRVLIDREAIAARVRAMGAEVAADLQRAIDRHHDPADAQVVLIPILTGALVFTADLIRQMPMMLCLRVVAVSSYPGRSMASKGAKIAGELPQDLAGKHVVIVDDILDTGQTLAVVKRLIQEQGPASVRICVLLRKPESCRKERIDADYSGFDIPDEFVVGYGLDYDGFYRNYPQIAVLRAAATSALESRA